jgi:hypothetical protein
MIPNWGTIMSDLTRFSLYPIGRVFGLQGMRERVRRIMAKFTIDTSPGSGTEITLVVPGGIIYRRTNSSGRKWAAIESLLKRMGLKSDSPGS